MKEKLNPFPIRNYISPAYFCNRNAELAKIIEAIDNDRNITLISLRRMGKTGLLHHYFHHLLIRNNVESFYFDIMGTNNLEEFIASFAKNVLGKLDNLPTRLAKKIGSFFKYLKAGVSYDPLTGQPSIEFSVEGPKHYGFTIEQIFDYLEQHNKRIVIAIDEFQQIIKYPERNVEAILRTNVQRCKNVSFIFSGSHKHLLISMFSNHGKPFYQSTEFLHLQHIDTKDYSKFITAKFKEVGNSISKEAVNYILEFTNCHTYYVQYICNKLCSKTKVSYDLLAVKNIISDILKEQETVYYSYRNLITPFQWLLLKAIAKEDGVLKITAKEFIYEHRLGAATSVKSAAKALIEKELIYFEGGKYAVYDVFFSKWLKVGL